MTTMTLKKNHTFMYQKYRFKCFLGMTINKGEAYKFCVIFGDTPVSRNLYNNDTIGFVTFFSKTFIC